MSTPSKELVEKIDAVITCYLNENNDGIDLNDTFSKRCEEMLNKLARIDASMKKLAIGSTSPESKQSKKTKQNKPKIIAKSRVRAFSESEMRIKEILIDPESIIKCADEVGYGTVCSIQSALPKNKFKTTGLVNQIWKKNIGCGLNSKQVRESLTRVLLNTLLKMEKKNRAQREGHARHTKWVLIK